MHSLPAKKILCLVPEGGRMKYETYIKALERSGYEALVMETPPGLANSALRLMDDPSIDGILLGHLDKMALEERTLTGMGGMDAVSPSCVERYVGDVLRRAAERKLPVVSLAHEDFMPKGIPFVKRGDSAELLTQAFNRKHPMAARANKKILCIIAPEEENFFEYYVEALQEAGYALHICKVQNGDLKPAITAAEHMDIDGIMLANLDNIATNDPQAQQKVSSSPEAKHFAASIQQAAVRRNLPLVSCNYDSFLSETVRHVDRSSEVAPLVAAFDNAFAESSRAGGELRSASGARI